MKKAFKALAAMVAVASLASCNASKYQFKKGDIVYLKSTLHDTTFFRIDSVLPKGYSAWDLNRGIYIPRTLGNSFKPVQPTK